MRYSRILFFVLLSMVLVFASCSQQEQSNPVSSQSGLTPAEAQRVINILTNAESSSEDQAMLESLSPADWSVVNAEIQKRGLVFVPDDYSSDQRPDQLSVSASTCDWDGTTRLNESLTKARSYDYEGHHAVYFTVDANACCYSKNADWWVLTWTPSHGDVHDWYLLLYRDNYWNGSKWVKDVVLLVPTTFWSVYYPHWPSSYKAGRFTISWYHQNNGCCE